MTVNRLQIFWPHIWPQKDRALQTHIALVGGCLVIERGLNVLIPMQMGRVTNALMADGLGKSFFSEVNTQLLTSSRSCSLDGGLLVYFDSLAWLRCRCTRFAALPMGTDRPICLPVHYDRRI